MSLPPKEQHENIVLTYPVIVVFADFDQKYFAPEGAEFFLDEHGIQWVKFVPTNGYDKGKEHMRRTERIYVVRDERKEFSIRATLGEPRPAGRPSS